MLLPLVLRSTCRSGALPKNIFSLNSRQLYSVSKQMATPNILANKLDKFTVTRRGMSGDHSKLWPIEKAVTLGLLGVVPLSIITPNLILDDAFAILTVMHFHWGLEACVADYIRPILFGAAIPKIALGLLYLLSAATLGGLLYYNHTCIGIGCTVRKFWEIKK